MKLPKSVTAYEGTPFDPLRFLHHVPPLADSEASTGLWDLSQLVDRLRAWRQHCPSVRPAWVLRRNDDPQVVRVASQLGCRFVCCSQGEAEELLRSHVSPEQIQWSSWVLTLAECKYARQAKIQAVQLEAVAAGAAGLRDLKLGHPEAALSLSTDGAEQLEAGLRVAQELQLNVRGIRVRPRSGSAQETSLAEVFRRAKEAVDRAEALGHRVQAVTVPEVGLGEDLSMDRYLQWLREMESEAQAVFGGRPEPLEVFCETRDALTTALLTIFLTVQAVRKLPTDAGEKVQYFVDDGRHNSFRKVPRSVRHATVGYVRRSGVEGGTGEVPLPTEVFGPSCDGDDVVINDRPLPLLSLGDLIYLRHVGTDTVAMRTHFNGFQYCQSHYFMRRAHLEADHWSRV